MSAGSNAHVSDVSPDGRWLVYGEEGEKTG